MLDTFAEQSSLLFDLAEGPPGPYPKASNMDTQLP